MVRIPVLSIQRKMVMKKTRVGAIVLAAVMAVTGINVQVTNVHAAETVENSAQESDAAVSGAADTADAVEPAAANPNAGEDTDIEENAATESDEADSDADADQKDDASTKAASEPEELSAPAVTETAETTETTEEDRPADTAERSLSSDDGIQVSFPAGTFHADGISLQTSVFTDEDILRQADEAMAAKLHHGQVHRILAYDISFHDGDQEREPEKEVDVSLPLEHAVPQRAYYIVHIHDGNEEIVPAKIGDDGAVDFTLQEFSPVILYDDAVVIGSWKFSGEAADEMQGNELTLSVKQAESGSGQIDGMKPSLRRNLLRKAPESAGKFNFDYIVSRLPGSITTVIDGQSTDLPLTWTRENTDYRQNSDGSWPQSGTYTFTAELDPKYETDAPITVTVKLLDDGTIINRPGITVSAAWGSRKEELTDDGLDLTVGRGTRLNLPISAGWPEGSQDREIDITCAYGLSFGDIWSQNENSCSYNTLSKTEHWYQQLEKMETPADNRTMDVFQGKKLFDGTLKLKFKDTTDALDIVDPNTGDTLWVTTDAGYITDLGLNSIGTKNSPALSVIFSYTLDGKKYSIEKKINTVTFSSKTDHLKNEVYFEDRVASYNKKRESQVSISNPVTAQAVWSAEVQDENNQRVILNTQGLMDNMYLCFELPRNASLVTDNGSGIRYYDQAKVSLPDGSSYTRKDKGNKILVLETGNMAGKSTLAKSQDIGGLWLKWQFKDPKDGELYQIQMVRTGMLYHTTDQWLTADNTVSLSFRMISDDEEVFINAPYASDGVLEGTNGGDWIWTYGEGAAGIGKEQEYILGGINLGNRKSNESVPKTVTIEYDALGKGYCGVSQQNFAYNNADNTNFYNLQVTLINPKTREVVKQSISKEQEQKIFNQNYVCRKDFTDDPGWYLKEVKYSIQSIPAKTQDDDLGRRMKFYGYVLNLPEKRVDLNDVKITVEDAAEDKDGNSLKNLHSAITGYSQIKLFNGVISNVPYVWQKTVPLTIGSRDNKISGTVKSYGYNYLQYATYIDALYFISPYGDELSKFRLSSTRNKVTKSLDVSNAMLSELNPSALQLPKGYEHAKVYRIDLTKLTSAEDKQYFRMVGSKYVTTAEGKTDTYGTGGDIDFSYVTSIDYSDQSGEVGNALGGLVYLQPHYPENGTIPSWGLYSSWMRDDTLKLTGNTANRVTSGINWQINGTDSLTVATSGKMTTEGESAYRIWNNEDPNSYIGSNNDINFRITLANTTNRSIRGISLYMPVPKKKDGTGWNGTADSDADFIQNDNFGHGSGEFGFNMDLVKGGTADTSGYQFAYAIVQNPSVKSSDWKNYTWYTADQISEMKAWDQVNFIHITNDTPIEPTKQSHIDFVFNAPAAIQKPGYGYTNQDVIDQKKNIFTPYYQCTYGTAIVHGMGEPIGAILAPGKIAGKVWFDQNLDGRISDQETGITGVKVTLTPEDTALAVQTVTTDKEGNYVFEGLLPGKKFTVSLANPDTDIYACFTIQPEKYAADSMVNNAQLNPDHADQISAASEQTSSEPYSETARDSFNLNMNFGLCPYVRRKAVLIWDDENDRDKLRSDVTILLRKKSGQEEDSGNDILKTAVIPKNAKSDDRNAVFDHLMPIEDNHLVDYSVTETMAANADQYTVTREIKDDGMTYLFTNMHGPKEPEEPAKHDPPVKKEITGDTPSSNARFVFVLQAKSTTAGVKMPMPEGSDGDTKTMTIEGEGSAEFGYLYFWKPGMYVYEIREENTGEQGYTYDSAVYTVTYEVVRDWDRLSVTRTYRKENKIADDIVFSNRYTAPQKHDGNSAPGSSSDNHSKPEVMNAEPAKVIAGAAAEKPAGEMKAEETGNNNSRRIPYTGDSSNLLFWAALFAIAGLADAIIILRRIRSGRS